MRERTQLEDAIKQYDELDQSLADYLELIELAVAEDDSEVLADAEKGLAELAATARVLELETMLSGEADGNDCFVEIHAGAGGTESQDWAAMLQRLYLRWAEDHEFQTDLWFYTELTDAGLLSAYWGVDPQQWPYLAYLIALSWVLVSLSCMYRAMLALIRKRKH